MGESKLSRPASKTPPADSVALRVGDSAEVDRGVHLEFEYESPSGLRDVHVHDSVGREFVVGASCVSYSSWSKTQPLLLIGWLLALASMHRRRSCSPDQK